MLNFPNAPANGEQSTQDNGVTYEWDSTLTRWTSVTSLGKGLVAGTVVGYAQDENDAHIATALTIPADFSIPQISEGFEFLSVAYTPKFANSLLIVEMTGMISAVNLQALVCLAIFDSVSGTDAIVASGDSIAAASALQMGSVRIANYAPGNTTPRVFSARIGANVGNSIINGSPSGDFYGRATKCTLTVTEIQPNAVVPSPLLPIVTRGFAALAFAAASGSITIDPTQNEVAWVRIGPLVHIQGRIRANSTSSPSGALTLTGLPFANVLNAGHAQSGYCSTTIWPDSITISPMSGAMVSRVNNGASHFDILDGGSGNADNMANKIQAGTVLYIQASYTTDDP